MGQFIGMGSASIRLTYKM